ncbi:MAG TPA: 3-oxoacyl-ACP synthase [Bacteroidia bacterium]|nr:3-oxoacyl-ACP synthase [Bacteroidia bacterium]
MSLLLFKQKLYKLLCEEMDNRIKELQITLDSAIHSRNSDTKSSAGDKHETGREMLQQEIDQYTSRLAVLNQQFQILKNINPEKCHKTIAGGSIVKTNTGIFFFSIAAQKIITDNQECFPISIDSPIGHTFKGKTAGESFRFNNREIEVLEVC